MKLCVAHVLEKVKCLRVLGKCIGQGRFQKVFILGYISFYFDFSAYLWYFSSLGDSHKGYKVGLPPYCVRIAVNQCCSLIHLAAAPAANKSGTSG